ncbi:MAG: AAA family ATPase, partial [Parahaliea sp.]
MYVRYYQLSDDPFRLTPDSRYVFAHESYRRTRRNLHEAMQQGEGVLVITGGPGTGKTMMMVDFLTALKANSRPVAVMSSPNLDENDTLRFAARALGIEDMARQDRSSLLLTIEQHLWRYPNSLLIIDEAQNLSEAALDELRLLTDLQQRGRPLLQLFLIGHPDLVERLRAPGMEALHQRLSALLTLEPLTLPETADFIVHRLSCAGWNGIPALDATLFPLLHRASQGLPRHICKLCARLLLHGATAQHSRLGFDDALAVILEMRDESLLPLTGMGGNMAIKGLPTLGELKTTIGKPPRERFVFSDSEREFLASHPPAFDTAVAPEPGKAPPSGEPPAARQATVDPDKQRFRPASRPAVTRYLQTTLRQWRLPFVALAALAMAVLLGLQLRSPAMTSPPTGTHSTPPSPATVEAAGKPVELPPPESTPEPVSAMLEASPAATSTLPVSGPAATLSTGPSPAAGDALPLAAATSLQTPEVFPETTP